MQFFSFVRTIVDKSPLSQQSTSKWREDLKAVVWPGIRQYITLDGIWSIPHSASTKILHFLNIYLVFFQYVLQRFLKCSGYIMFWGEIFLDFSSSTRKYPAKILDFVYFPSIHTAAFPYFFRGNILYTAKSLVSLSSCCIGILTVSSAIAFAFYFSLPTGHTVIDVLPFFIPEVAP